MPSQLIFIVLSGLLGLGGCHWLQPSSTVATAESLPLLHPIGPSRRIVQSINATWQERQNEFLCVLELDKRHLSMAALNPQGMSLFNLNYDGKQLNITKNPLLPDNLPPDRIVKDLQLAFWPLTLLQEKLPKNWRLTAGERQRRLYSGNRLVSEINYAQPDPLWPKKVELINHSYHYKLLINTVSYETLPE